MCPSYRRGAQAGSLALHGGIDGPSNDARVALFGVPNPTGFVHIFVGNADIAQAGFSQVGRSLVVAARPQFAPCLRRVILVSKAPLRLRLDIQRVGLRAVRGSDQVVMRLLRLCQSRLKLGCFPPNLRQPSRCVGSYAGMPPIDCRNC
jgi:hypothetical protein